MRPLLALLALSLFAGCGTPRQSDPGWISLFNGRDLTGWSSRGKATWSVQDGVIVGVGGMGHLYADAVCTNFEARGEFRVSEQGAKANSGYYFRANPPVDNPEGFPRGYEAQICNSQDAFTGWLWKPGKPTGKAEKLLTRDGEWFEYRIRAVGSHIEFWINGTPVMTHDDAEYVSGHFAIQGHNPGMKIEARKLYYRPLPNR